MKKATLLTLVNIFLIIVSYGQGTVRGKVSDKNGETLIGVTVVLKSNRSVGAVTDLDGNYSLKITDSVPQTIIVSYVSYQNVEVTVHPLNNEVIIQDFVLESVATELVVVEVVAKASKANNYYMENLKKNSSATLDYISSETMKKTGDVNVASAVARVPGVSNSSSGLITVRGIGDRYVKTTINGSRIPTLDPFTNNIKLDMFPSSLVDNIIITKTASPDLPGDWAGAYLSVETKDYPEQLTINAESSFGYNNQSTFKNILTSDRSSTDWLGFDNGLRSHNHRDFVQVDIAPSEYDQFVALGLGAYFNSIGVTRDNWQTGSAAGETYTKLGLVQLGLLAATEFDDVTAVKVAKDKYYKGTYTADAFKILNADAVKSSQSFPNNWNTSYRKAPLNFSQSFSIGNQTKLFGKPLGVLAGFRYGSSVQYDPNASANRIGIDALGNTSIQSRSTEETSKELNGWSALVNLAYKFNPNNSIALLFMPNFSGANNVRYNINDADPNELNLNKTQFYEQRKQLIYQLKSEHYIPRPKLKLELNASYTNGKSIAPDFKRLGYSKNPTQEIYSIGQGMNRSFRYLTDNIFDSQISVEFPIGSKPGLTRKLKFGAAYMDNHRDGLQYEYYSRYGPYVDLTLVGGNLEDFYSLDKFDLSSGINEGLAYNTIDIYYSRVDYPANHVIGFSKITAGYGMFDYSIVPSLRIAGGLRIEHANIFADAYEYNKLGYADDDLRRKHPAALFTLIPAKLNKTSLLPSLNIIYKLKRNDEAPVNLRVNYSKTLARPSIRELTNVDVYDYELRAVVYGDANLKIAEIQNYDLRLESYFKNGDNISVSLFYKDFKNHIEIADAPFGYTWINVDKSWVKGIELEGKKKLTKRFDLRANITFVESRTTYLHKGLFISNGEKTYVPIGQVTRTMYGQAPYIINGIVGYKEDSLGLAISVSYNVQGPRLVISAFDRLFEVYELPRHTIDIKATKSLGKHFGISITVRDILNAPIRRSFYSEAGWVVDYDKYRYGTNYLLGLSYKL